MITAVQKFAHFQGIYKKASILDGLIGAPIGAIAAALAAKKEDKKKAITRGLLLGSLLGFIQGQRSTKAMKENKDQPVPSPAVVSLLAGLGAGALTRVSIPNLGK